MILRSPTTEPLRERRGRGSRRRGERGGGHRLLPLLRTLVVVVVLLLPATPFRDRLGATTTTAGSGFRVAAFAIRAARRCRSGVAPIRAVVGRNRDGRDDDDGGLDLDDPSILRDLVVASSLSYLSSDDDDDGGGVPSRMEASPYFSGSGMTPLAQVVDPKTESGATIFRYDKSDGDDDDDDGTLLVACRGSATPVNFSTNLRFRLVPLDEDDDDELVHEGFKEASAGLWERLERALRGIAAATTTTTTGNPIRRVVFTGHSLGAATAVLCAVRYQEDRAAAAGGDDDLAPLPPLRGVVTFGGPRLANVALADRWNAGPLDDSAANAAVDVVANYVHDRDPILRQNGPLWDALGFGVVGREIRCEPYELATYVDENENDREDRKLPVAWNILDHCNYLGVFVGPRLV